MNTLHVVTLVPPPGKAIALLRPVAIWKVTEIWIMTVVMHAMCLSLMSEKAGVGSET
jgi:hypothetical protein